MTHTFLYLIFILSFTAWLGAELKIDYNLKKYKNWIIATFVVGVSGSLAARIGSETFGNFLLHASGGVASAVMFGYVIRTLRLRFNWRVETVLMFGFVSALGVLNELAEYSLEFLGLGPFSFDKHDTWRDLVANTTGALICWAVIKSISVKRKA